MGAFSSPARTASAARVFFAAAGAGSCRRPPLTTTTTRYDNAVVQPITTLAHVGRAAPRETRETGPAGSTGAITAAVITSAVAGPFTANKDC
jgi:hypothetical protein